MEARTVERKFRVRHIRKGQKAIGQADMQPLTAPPRVPRIARLMALAIRFDHLIRDGHMRGQSELAALGRVTPARLSQIMNLLLLAPDIQEAILFLEPTTRGRDRIKERDLRPIAIEPDWRIQRHQFGVLIASDAAADSLNGLLTG